MKTERGIITDLSPIEISQFNFLINKKPVELLIHMIVQVGNIYTNKFFLF